MAGIQAGAKAVDGLIDIGVNSLNEALLGNYYRDKEIEQSKKLLDQQTDAQSKLMKQSKDQQLAMWNGTNYEAQTAHLQAAGLNPALMYGAGGGGGSTTAGSGAGGGSAAGVGLPTSTGVGMGIQWEQMEAQKELAKAEAAKPNAEAAK